MAVIADIAGNKKGEKLSWFSSVTIIGNLLGAPIGGFVLYSLSQSATPSLADFQKVYLLSGFAGVMSLLFAWRYLKGAGSLFREESGLKTCLRKVRIGHQRGCERPAGGRHLQHGRVAEHDHGRSGSLPARLCRQSGRVQRFQAGLLWGIQVLATILSKPIMGKISDGTGRKPVIAAGMVLCAVSFACVPMLNAFYLLLITSAFFGLGEAFVTSSSAALVADHLQGTAFRDSHGNFRDHL